MNPISTHRLLMIRPARFGYNEQTRSTNAFQAKNHPRGHGIDIKLDSSVPGDDRSDSISRQDPFVQQALLEFDQSVARIQAAGVHVTVWNDSPHPTKPDAVFLNNWFSTHPDGRYILYPMMAENRRIEIDPVHVAALEGIGLHKSLDLSPWTSQQQFLEGTGSLVFDHLHRVVFCYRIAPHPSNARRIGGTTPQLHPNLPKGSRQAWNAPIPHQCCSSRWAQYGLCMPGSPGSIGFFIYPTTAPTQPKTTD
jgi:hypothetical protein